MFGKILCFLGYHKVHYVGYHRYCNRRNCAWIMWPNYEGN